MYSKDLFLCMYSSSIVSIYLVQMSDIEFEVVSYNVNGIGDDRKRIKIVNFLKKQTSNKAVIFMQEIHSTKATEKRFEYQWGGKMLFTHLE